MIKKLKDWFYKTLTYNGAETFFYPESKYILKMINYTPDIIQLHNIREFFDIRVLKSWSEHSKIFIRVCDLWLFTGHCALPLDCDKYITGCGHCPDLSLIPEVRGDKTRENLTFKKKQILDLPINFIYPSKWVEKKMSRIRLNEKSSTRVIEDSVDLNKFIPNKSEIFRTIMSSWLTNMISKIFGVSISDADKEEENENFLSPKYNSEEMELSNLKVTVPNPTTISIDGGEGSFDFQGDYDKLRELVNQANEFWMVLLSDSSNSFFQCHIGENIYEYWKDGEMLFSSKGSSDEALTFFWKLTI